MTQRVLYSGPAQGGPLDGQEVNSRYSGGFIVVSKKHGQSGVYRYTEEKTLVYQEDNSYVNDFEKLAEAAESDTFDIRSV